MNKLNIDLASTTQQIRDAASHPECWPDALKAMENYLEVDNVNLVMIHGNNPAISAFQASSLPPEVISNYQQKFPSGDVWIHSLSTLPAGGVYRSSSLYPNQRLVYTKFYEEFLRPINLFHCAGGFFEHFGDSFGMMSALLPLKAKGFDDARIEKMVLINQHLKSALHTSSSLSCLKTSLDLKHQALSSQNIALALTKMCGTPVYLNQPFEILLRQKTIVRLSQNKIAFQSQSAQRWYRNQLRQLQKTGEVPQIGEVPPDKSEHQQNNNLSCGIRMHMSAIQGADSKVTDTASTLALLSIMLPPARHTTVERLKSLGVPPTAALVAYHLLAGKSAREVSLNLNTSYETVRSHIKRLFRHFQVNNQRQLTALLNALTK